MKRSILGILQFDEKVGLVVVLCVAAFVAALIHVGLLKEWFQPSTTLRIMLPEEGVSGLAPGAEVLVLGTRAGEVRRIVIDPDEGMHAVARVDDRMKYFIRQDSTVSIRRQFAVAGAAYIEISRGSGPPLDWNRAILSARSEKAPTDTLDGILMEVRGKVMPLLDDVQRATAAFTEVARRAADPTGPLERTLSSTAVIAERLEKGEGTVGQLLASDKLVAELQLTVENTRSLIAQLERTAKDPQIGQVLRKTDSVLTSLQTTMRSLASSTPKIADNVVATTDALPATLLQAQIAAHELELLLGQLRRSWLLGGSGTPPAAPSRRLPPVEVRP
ncbi:MlaD family protein [Reyranella sp.]|uniref:MlaD family protein n=1 Tax=Reyranella sp. TaxID=1929291 RepID=UPI003BAB2C24